MLMRIAGKLINKTKIHQKIDDILDKRRQGLSQQEVARLVGIDRTVISRLESIAEIRKGDKIALLGFPIANCQELYATAQQEGVEYCLLMTEKERWDFLNSKNGAELFNSIMDIITILRQYDVIIIIGSDFRIKLTETVVGKDVIGVQIGESPIEEDQYVNPEQIRKIVRQISRLSWSEI